MVRELNTQNHKDTGVTKIGITAVGCGAGTSEGPAGWLLEIQREATT